MNKANWSVQEAIQKRVEEEAWYDWSQKPVAQVEYDYRPSRFVVTEAIKQAFASSFEFIGSLPKL